MTEYSLSTGETEKLAKKIHSSIYMTENLHAQHKQEAAEDGISYSQRCLSLILIGRRAESSTERDKERTTREIQKLVAAEYRRQNQNSYINSDRVVPLNRYEVKKQRLEEPPDRKSNPLSADYDDGFSKIFDGVEKQEELEERAARYLRSNWHPAFGE